MSSWLTKTYDDGNGGEVEKYVYDKQTRKTSKEPEGFAIDFAGKDLSSGIHPHIANYKSNPLLFSLYPDNTNKRDIIREECVKNCITQQNPHRSWTLWVEFKNDTMKQQMFQDVKSYGLMDSMWTRYQQRKTIMIGFNHPYARAWFIRKYYEMIHPASLEYFFKHLDIFKLKICISKVKEENEWKYKAWYNPKVQDHKVYEKMATWSKKQTEVNQKNHKAAYAGGMREEETWDIIQPDDPDFKPEDYYDGTHDEFRAWVSFWKENDMFYKREAKRAGPNGYVWDEISPNLQGLFNQVGDDIEKIKLQLRTAIQRAQNINPQNDFTLTSDLGSSIMTANPTIEQVAPPIPTGADNLSQNGEADRGTQNDRNGDRVVENQNRQAAREEMIKNKEDKLMQDQAKLAEMQHQFSIEKGQKERMEKLDKQETEMQRKFRELRGDNDKLSQTMQVLNSTKLYEPRKRATSFMVENLKQTVETKDDSGNESRSRYASGNDLGGKRFPDKYNQEEKLPIPKKFLMPTPVYQPFQDSDITESLHEDGITNYAEGSQYTENEFESFSDITNNSLAYQDLYGAPNQNSTMFAPNSIKLDVVKQKNNTYAGQPSKKRGRQNDSLSSSVSKDASGMFTLPKGTPPNRKKNRKTNTTPNLGVRLRPRSDDKISAKPFPFKMSPSKHKGTPKQPRGKKAHRPKRTTSCKNIDLLKDKTNEMPKKSKPDQNEGPTSLKDSLDIIDTALFNECSELMSPCLDKNIESTDIDGEEDKEEADSDKDISTMQAGDTMINGPMGNTNIEVVREMLEEPDCIIVSHISGAERNSMHKISLDNAALTPTTIKVKTEPNQ